MNTEEKEAVLIALMTGLREQKSWCGETHVQKAAYLLQEGLDVPIGLDFVLYKHGPYSFDLHNLLGEMRADMLVTAQARPYPYGPTLVPTSNASHVETRHSGLVDQHRGKITYLACQLASHGVASLERLGTALYVMRKHSEISREQQTQKIVSEKPHISENLATKALEEIDDLLTGTPA